MTSILGRVILSKLFINLFDEWRKIHVLQSKLLIPFVAISLILAGCSETQESEPTKEETPKETEVNEEVKTETKSEPETTQYSADNAYQWLEETGLVSGEAEDVTSKFEGSEGLVKALRTDEADIIEFETDENAAYYHNPDLSSYAVKNIYILIKKGQDNAASFVSVLENGKASNYPETAYSSDAQKAFVESTQDGADFGGYVEGFYNLPSEERSSTFDSYIIDKEVTWSGTIADLEAIGDSIVVYGKDDYSGEDWLTISTDKMDMMPYTFIVELKEESTKTNLQSGDHITIKGVVGSRGDKDMQYNWKLYEGEIVK